MALIVDGGPSLVLDRETGELVPFGSRRHLKTVAGLGGDKLRGLRQHVDGKKVVPIEDGEKLRILRGITDAFEEAANDVVEDE